MKKLRDISTAHTLPRGRCRMGRWCAWNMARSNRLDITRLILLEAACVPVGWWCSVAPHWQRSRTGPQHIHAHLK